MKERDTTDPNAWTNELPENAAELQEWRKQLLKKLAEEIDIESTALSFLDTPEAKPAMSGTLSEFILFLNMQALNTNMEEALKLLAAKLEAIDLAKGEDREAECQAFENTPSLLTIWSVNKKRPEPEQDAEEALAWFYKDAEDIYRKQVASQSEENQVAAPMDGKDLFEWFGIDERTGSPVDSTLGSMKGRQNKKSEEPVAFKMLSNALRWLEYAEPDLKKRFKSESERAIEVAVMGKAFDTVRNVMNIVTEYFQKGDVNLAKQSLQAMERNLNDDYVKYQADEDFEHAAYEYLLPLREIGDKKSNLCDWMIGFIDRVENAKKMGGVHTRVADDIGKDWLHFEKIFSGRDEYAPPTDPRTFTTGYDATGKGKKDEMKVRSQTTLTLQDEGHESDYSPDDELGPGKSRRPKGDSSV